MCFAMNQALRDLRLGTDREVSQGLDFIILLTITHLRTAHTAALWGGVRGERAVPGHYAHTIVNIDLR